MTLFLHVKYLNVISLYLFKCFFCEEASDAETLQIFAPETFNSSPRAENVTAQCFIVLHRVGSQMTDQLKS